MIPDEITPVDEGFVARAMAYNAALEAGNAPESDEDRTEIGLPPEGIRRCLRLLDEVYAHPEPDLEALPASPDGRVCLGSFEILNELGRGGFGIVYLAYDPELRRRVALKIPLPAVLATSDVRRRFLREARAAARLDHPGIVPVHEAGEIGPIAYIASAYCPGMTLHEWIKARPDPVPAQAAARLVAMIADAVQHAHERGVLHRDLKPGNVLLQPPEGATGDLFDRDDLVPRVTDFGLAKFVDELSEDTRTGVPLGSPAHMAPEQAAGRHAEVSTASDVYALGSILYMVLTGRPPFRAETTSQTIRLVLETEPLSPRALRPGLPRDLETICLACLRKEPHRRYPSAADLAVDLRRFLAGEPIQARPISWWEHGLRWARRHPAHATLGALVLTLVVGWNLSLHHVLVQLRHVKALDDQHTAALNKALRGEQRALQMASRRAYAAKLRRVQDVADDGQLERAQELLLELRPKTTSEADLREFAWRLSWGQVTGSHEIVGEAPGPIHLLACTSDGQTLVVADYHGRMTIWDLDQRISSGELHWPGTWKLQTMNILDDDQTLVASFSIPDQHDTALMAWDLATRQPQFSSPGFAEIRSRGEFLQTTRRLTLFGSPVPDCPAALAVQAWDFTETPPRRHWEHMVDVAPGSVASASGGSRLVLVQSGGTVTVLDRESGDVCFQLETALGATSDPGAWSAAITDDGRRLAVTHRCSVQVWDLETRQRLWAWKCSHLRSDALSPVCAFAPDGARLMVHFWQALPGDKTPLDGESRTRVWELTGPEPRELITVPSTFAGAGGVDYSDPWLVVTGDNGARLWNVTTGELVADLPTGGSSPDDYLFMPQRRLLVYGGDDRLIRVWPLAPREPRIERLAGHSNKEVWALAFTPDGRTLISAGDDNLIKLWDLASGAERATLTGHESLITALAVSPDGLTLASASFDGTIRLWSTATGTSLATLRGHPDQIRAVAWSPDGVTLASGGDDGAIRLWNAPSRRIVTTLRGHANKVRALVFSPEGTTLASAGNDNVVRLWGMPDGRLIRERADPYAVLSLAWSPAGTTLASGNDSGAITLCQPDGALTLKGHRGEVFAVGFSPDGRTLASAGKSGTLRLWEPISGQELRVLGADSRPSRCLAWSPDGTILAAG